MVDKIVFNVDYVVFFLMKMNKNISLLYIKM